MPWRRLLTLFGVYAAVATVALLVLARGNLGESLTGLLAGLVLYLGFAWVLVKFGWNPPSLRPRQAAREAQARKAAATSAAAASATVAPDRPRPKPAPTRRTNATNARARTSRRR